MRTTHTQIHVLEKSLPLAQQKQANPKELACMYVCMHTYRQIDRQTENWAFRSCSKRKMYAPKQTERQRDRETEELGIPLPQQVRCQGRVDCGENQEHEKSVDPAAHMYITQLHNILYQTPAAHTHNAQLLIQVMRARTRTHAHAHTHTSTHTRTHTPTPTVHVLEH